MLYTLFQNVDIEKKEKMAKEILYDEEVKAQEPADSKEEKEEGSENSFVYKDQTFSIGDFVYIEPRCVTKLKIWCKYIEN